MRRVISQHFDVPQMHDLVVAGTHGAYASLPALARLRPQEIVERVVASGLRGRGGAGFPTGRKWMAALAAGAAVELVVNADESEPGTFKDREILLRDPHLLLEGVLIAARALGAGRAFFYVRGEEGEPVRRLSAAIDAARDAGFFTLPAVLYRGAGAYICGEETALLNSIEGRRGMPRLRPPYPTSAGLLGRPTVVQNVETLCSLPFIASFGAAAFRELGTEESPGTKLVSVSGNVAREGVHEVEMGTSVAAFLEECAGGVRGGALKALLPGGASSPVLTRSEALGAHIDFESMAAAGSALGAGGMIVVNDRACMVRVLQRIAQFFARESCGECTPCREGCGWVVRIVQRIEEGLGREGDVDLLLEAAGNMEGRTICGLASGLVAAARSIVTKFRHEFEEHVRRGRCSFGT